MQFSEPVLRQQCPEARRAVLRQPTQGETTRLKLSNKLYRPIVVRLERLGDPGRRDITVPARSSESVKVKPGTYKYSAVAEGFRPISKYKELEAKRSYTLYF